MGHARQRGNDLRIQLGSAGHQARAAGVRRIETRHRQQQEKGTANPGQTVAHTPNGCKEPGSEAGKCDGCGLCATLCEFGAIRENGAGFVVDPVRCEGCKVCVAFCPAAAIRFPERHCGQWYVSSTRFGPHYGASSAILAGQAVYAVGDGLNLSSHSTDIADGCVTCHMASAIGYNAGGHSFKVYDDVEGGINVAGCQECHPDAEAETLTEEFQPEIVALSDSLGVLLEAAGIYNPAGTAGYAIKGDFTNKVAGAYWNWAMVHYDWSDGVHNPKFVKKLLENTIASLQ